MILSLEQSREEQIFADECAATKQIVLVEQCAGSVEQDVLLDQVLARDGQENRYQPKTNTTIM